MRQGTVNCAPAGECASQDRMDDIDSKVPGPPAIPLQERPPGARPAPRRTAT